MSKNIVIFSDGTGKEGGKNPETNIYRLFNMIEDRTNRQISFYDRGLGTGWRKISGRVSGAGISRNIIECYTFLFENFEAGDQIFLFGFSRGAATVRSLSSFIHYFGILPKSRPELIQQAYTIYKISDNLKRKRQADDFIAKHHTMWTKIKFIGCFDTVAALGLPIKALDRILDKLPGLRHKFHNFTLSEAVENAYHAVAIDDQRLPFHPLLWDAEVLPGQHMKQVWFCGMHTDIGGGYLEQALSNITLEWMKAKAVQHGLFIYPKNDSTYHTEVNGYMHDSLRKWWARGIYVKKERFWSPERSDKPIVHHTVLQRKKNLKNEDSPAYNPWILNQQHEVEG